MTDLLRRLAAATEGSRELSDAVLLACGWACDADEAWGGPVRWRSPTNVAFYGDRPDPTRSIDDAMALVPEGAVWHVMNDYGLPGKAYVAPDGKTIYRSNVYDAENFDAPRIFEATAETPYLAICIAIVKARAAIKEQSR